MDDRAYAGATDTALFHFHYLLWKLSPEFIPDKEWEIKDGMNTFANSKEN